MSNNGQDSAKRKDHLATTGGRTNVLIIDPHAVYTLASLTQTLGLRDGSLPREIRKGRLRVTKRCGRLYFLGEWVTQWLLEGEVRRQSGPATASVQNGVEQ